MPDIEPDEVGGLQDIVSFLKSVIKTQQPTDSVSFRVFSQEVPPTLHIKLLPLCFDLDFYLVKKPSGRYSLEFDLKKNKAQFIYAILKEIKNKCMYMTKDKWYYKFLKEDSNIAQTEKAIKEGLRLRKK